ncbi:DUF1389 domain-containing protein [Chlamydia crocodili]|uniref:DUF1389 domain-containing protein n=1 Tax=Chlamydia crocodili TaxID=2766982 RepID=UPI003D4058BB
MASVVFSGISEPIIILGLVISLVLCGSVLISTLYYSRRPHVIITPVIDPGISSSISPSTEEGSFFEDFTEVSPSSTLDSQFAAEASSQEEIDPVSELLSEVVSIVALDSDVVHEASFEEESIFFEDSVEVGSRDTLDSTIDGVEPSDNDFVLAETPESYSENATASMLNSNVIREECFDEESTSILNTAFNLSPLVASDVSTREEDSLEIDMDLSSLYDSQLAINTEAAVDVANCVDERKLIPQGFLEIVEKNYPRIIYQICIDESLTVQELRLLIEGLIENRRLENYPESLRIKLQSFGLSIIELNCHNIELQLLDEILLKECPFYFLNKLIALGNRELPAAERISPAVYWTSRLGFVSQMDTIFIPSVWILSRVATREEYVTLFDHAKNNTWNQTQDLISDLQNRLMIYLDSEYNPSFSCTKSSVRWDLRTSSWLFYLSKHGLSWEQLQLFRKIDSRSVNFLCEIEQQGRGGHLARNMVSVFAYINENQENFDSNIALFTWEEWMRDYSESTKRGERWRTHESTIRLLNAKRNELDSLKETSFDCEELSGLPYYTYDFSTGERRTLS